MKGGKTYMMILYVLYFLTFIGLNAQEVTIGSQTWAAVNLNVTTFRNGEKIPEAKTNADWVKASNEGKPAWCFIENDQSKEILYNWYAVNDPRGLAPSGWHIPTYEEWLTLVNYLGGTSIAGKQLLGSSENDTVKFSARLTGWRGFNGPFGEIGSRTMWWSSKEYSSRSTICLKLNDTGYILLTYDDKGIGMSVRCIKD